MSKYSMTTAVQSAMIKLCCNSPIISNSIVRSRSTISGVRGFPLVSKKKSEDDVSLIMADRLGLKSERSGWEVQEQPT